MAASLALVTYNIRRGIGANGRGDGRLEPLASALATCAPQLLLCQEVFHPADGGPGQSQVLADALGLNSYYEPNRQRRRGSVGNATMTHLPAERCANHNISTNWLEHRGVLYVRLRLGDRPLHIFNAHLGLNQHQRNVQVRRIRGLLSATCAPGEPVILAGDFNDWNRRLDPQITQQLQLTNVAAHLQGRAGLTYHAQRPLFSLDRIYVRNLVCHAVARLAGSPWDVLSDHLPLRAELALSG